MVEEELIRRESKTNNFKGERKEIKNIWLELKSKGII
jgi:hypothetical protein